LDDQAGTPCDGASREYRRTQVISPTPASGTNSDGSGNADSGKQDGTDAGNTGAGTSGGNNGGTDKSKSDAEAGNAGSGEKSEPSNVVGIAVGSASAAGAIGIAAIGLISRKNRLAREKNAAAASQSQLMSVSQTNVSVIGGGPRFKLESNHGPTGATTPAMYPTVQLSPVPEPAHL
jgi:hypothetical protein